MKKSIKRLTLLLALLMIFATLSTALVGCGGNGDETTTGTPGGGTPSGDTVAYSVLIKTAGGMKLSGISVDIVSSQTGKSVLTSPVATSEAGAASFNLPKSEHYYITLTGVPRGYAVQDKYFFTGESSVITLTSSVIKPSAGSSYVTPAQGSYKLGSVMNDFSYVDVDGNTQTLSELLKTKNAVMLNFWYINCPNCVDEFPLIEESYVTYKSKLEVLALNNYNFAFEQESDTPEAIKDFRDQMQLTFPMVYDTSYLKDAFDYSQFEQIGYPTTIMIDRYGVVCMIAVGAIVEDKAFDKIFSHFTADNYEQKIVNSLEDIAPREKPNVSMPSSEEMSAVFNKTGVDIKFYPEQSEELAEYSWPFIIVEREGETVLKPSNSGKNYTYSFLHADVPLKKGEVLAFDYYSSTELNADRLFTRVNGEDMQTISGVTNSGWKSCFSYVAAEDDTYRMTFMFVKDSDTSEGEDAVFLKNLRITTIDQITEPTYIPRYAATEPNAGGTGYNTYPTLVYNEKDTYYHVGSADGPILFANLIGTSRFNDGESSVNDYYVMSKLTRYYFESTNNGAIADEYEIELVDGGYRFFRYVKNVKNYLSISYNSTLGRPIMSFETDAKKIERIIPIHYDATVGAWVIALNNQSYYLGSAGDFTLVDTYRVDRTLSNNPTGYYPIYLMDNAGNIVTSPTAGTKYRLAFNQTRLGQTRYISGDIKELGEQMLDHLVHASNSKLSGYTSVNGELRELLMKVAEQDFAHRDELYPENTWMQFCRYYEAYATNGEQLEDPIKGLAYHSAFEAVEDNKDTPEVEKNTVVYDGTPLMPRGYFYRFTPSVSGVYAVYSYGDPNVEAWLFTEESKEVAYTFSFNALDRIWPKNGECTTYMYMYMEAGKNYYVDVAFDDLYQAGSIDFVITYEGVDMEVLRYCSDSTFTALENMPITESNLITGGLMNIVYDAENNCFYEYYGDDKNNRNPKPIYLDLTGIAPIINKSVMQLIEMGAFDFSKSDVDDDILFYMNEYPEDYEAHLRILYGDLYDQSLVDDVENGIYHGDMFDYTKTERDIFILEYMTKYPSDFESRLANEWQERWHEAYNQAYVDDVKNGIYHGSLFDYKWRYETVGTDYTERVKTLINEALAEIEAARENAANDPDNPLLNVPEGCIIINYELAEIMQHLIDKESFQGVPNAWTKLCCYYAQFTADTPMGK